MERLTKKVENEYLTAEDESEVNWFDFVEKLGKLEDLEEQIGCPLEIRCNICDNSIIYDQFGKKWLVRSVFSDAFIAYDYDLCNEKNPKIERGLFYWKDYKVTWWLKADRSE